MKKVRKVSEALTPRRNSTRVRIALIGLLLLALIAMGVYADDAVRNAKITDAEVEAHGETEKVRLLRSSQRSLCAPAMG